MRAVRAVDGAAYNLDLQQCDKPYDGLRAQLAEISEIPAVDLIALHPNGRQVDVETARLLFSAASGSTPPEGLEPVYLFDRQLIELDPDSTEAHEYVSETDWILDRLLGEVQDDPSAQRDIALDLIHAIRSQHGAVSTALLNLARHTGGKQETIKAYSLFASPLMSSYAEMLESYSANISLVSKVKVSPKLRPPADIQERTMIQYINEKRMEGVRDGCAKTLDQLAHKNGDLEQVLKLLSDGTGQLEEEHAANTVDDLDECEKDAVEDCKQVLEMQSDTHFPQPDQTEVDELQEEITSRLAYLVQRRNEGVRVVLRALHRVRELQSLLTESGDLAAALDRDLRTKTDGFKHLQRLGALVPSYVATLAESIRRRTFTAQLRACGGAVAELLGKLNAEEKKRRGRYTAEWAGKLPWEVPGLEESVPSAEVDIRASSSASGQEATLADLEEVEEALNAIAASIPVTEEADKPENHPVRSALALLVKQKKAILDLQSDFAALLAKLDEGSAPASGATSVAVSRANTNGDAAAEQLSNLQERCERLERIIQDERGQAEQKLNISCMRNAELTKERNALNKERLRLESECSTAESSLKAARAASDSAQADVTRLEQEKSVLASRVEEAERNNASLQQTLDDTTVERDEARSELDTLQKRFDNLSEEREELVELVGEKERLLRDTKSEAELDRATLERALAAEVERVSKLSTKLQEAESATASAEAKFQSLSAQQESHDSETAELQVMCNERGKALEDAKRSTEATQAGIKTLLILFRLFFDSYVTHLRAIIDAPLPVVGVSSPSKGDSSPSGEKYDVPAFDATDLSCAVKSIKAFDESLMQLARRKTDECGNQVKRWAKECKRYKERAKLAAEHSKEKLAFKSFAKMDLALFLPTRNSTTQVFAAFNAHRPNYFLKATGAVAEQIRTREWIIARIVDITEGLADADDPASNPYGLAPGSKFWMCEAEPYAGRSGKNLPASKGRPADLVTRRASTSDVPPRAVVAIATQTDEADRKEQEPEVGEESFSILNDSMAISPVRPQALRSASTPASATRPAQSLAIASSPPIAASTLPTSRPSNLTAARPANLEPVPEVLTPVAPPLALPEEGSASLLPVPVPSASSLGASPPAFLPVGSPGALHRRAISSAAARPLSTSMPRSLGSSNGSGAGSSFLHRRMTSSFLGKAGQGNGKGSPTTATTPQQQTQYTQSRSWGSESSSPGKSAAPGMRQTQTIGRYTGRKDRRQASASISNGSGSSTPSAADLLRSFTVDM